MNKKINRSSLWSELFVEELVKCGLRYAVLSPGSRNTPLTSAFARHSSVTCFSLIDERSAAFFALGIARASGIPAAVVSTSGTAAAEYFPAVIEAYQQRTPLIICTADRPLEMLDCGTNQTISQTNLYGGFAVKFFDAGLPEVTQSRLRHIRSLARRSYFESLYGAMGPVHINFPFRKPLESFAFTDEIEESLLTEIMSDDRSYQFAAGNSSVEKAVLHDLFKKMIDKRIMFIAGPASADASFSSLLSQLACRLGSPVLADGMSNLRSGGHDKSNFFCNYEGYLRSQEFISRAGVETIILFGKNPTSKAIEGFLENFRGEIFPVNSGSNWIDPYNSSAGIIRSGAAEFCNSFLEFLDGHSFIAHTDNEYLRLFTSAEKNAGQLKEKYISEAEFPFEGRIITELISEIPENSAIMISNSMPARDLDYFAPLSRKDITIFNNRGASGIDGITSTALGISAVLNGETGRRVILVTGDLAFYYDLNGLLAAKKYSLNLTVILVNNNGGGIFEMLPVAKEKDIFDEYFITPHHLDFKGFTESYGGRFTEITSWPHFRSSIAEATIRDGLQVLQIRTDPEGSTLLRRDYWQAVASGF